MLVDRANTVVLSFTAEKDDLRTVFRPACVFVLSSIIKFWNPAFSMHPSSEYIGRNSYMYMLNGAFSAGVNLFWFLSFLHSLVS